MDSNIQCLRPEDFKQTPPPENLFVEVLCYSGRIEKKKWWTTVAMVMNGQWYDDPFVGPLKCHIYGWRYWRDAQGEEIKP